MEHQYPGPVGGDESMLAELMLPDQTHLRSQDWTIFFLHKDAGGNEDDKNSNDDASTSSSSSTDDSLDGPPLVYVLNLVNTKQDHTVKRGAIVKAMAICTRHPFLHIYKPLLLLALEQYFANPVVATLASLYDAVNTMDLSLMPRLSYHERSILQSTEAKDMFIEKFESIITQRMATSPAASPTTATTALGGRTPYGLPRDTHDLDSLIHYFSHRIPVKVPVALSPETVGDFSLVKLITTFSVPHSTSPLPFSPTHPHLTTQGPLTHPILVLLNALLTQKRIIFLGHNLPSSDVASSVLAACCLASGGLLRGFTRHAFPYTDLTKIDDLLKVPGFIAGVTNPAFANKMEWWDLLCDVQTGRMTISKKVEPTPLTEGVAYFQSAGNLAGLQSSYPSTNGSSTASINAIAAAGASLSAGLGGTISVPASGDPTGDAAFISQLLLAIADRHGESAIRHLFRQYVGKFTRIAAAFEEVVYGASALLITSASTPSPDSPPLPAEVSGHGYVWPSAALRTAELAANATRIEGWRNTRSYYNFIQDLAASYRHRAVKRLDLQHLHDQLRKLRLSADVSGKIYTAIADACVSEEALTQLLAVVVEGEGYAGRGGTTGALFYLGLGLWHPGREVRGKVRGLLERIRGHEAGRVFWAGVGGWVRQGVLMVGREEAGERGEEG